MMSKPPVPAALRRNFVTGMITLVSCLTLPVLANGSGYQDRTDSATGLVPLSSSDPQLRQREGAPQIAQATPKKTPVRGSSFSDPAPRRSTPRAGDDRTTDRPASPRGGAASAVAASVAAARAAGATPVATPMPLQPAPAGGNGFTGLGWDVLAGYKYREPIPSEGSKPRDNAAQRPKNQIPPTVQAWNKQKVEVEGWMVPMEVDDNGLVKSFVLVRTQPECCFGDTQAMNEWIEVRMSKSLRTDFVLDRPIRVRGNLEVGELIEDGFVLSLYRMTAVEVLS